MFIVTVCGNLLTESDNSSYMNRNFSQRLKHSILKLKLQQFLVEISEAFMLIYILSRNKYSVTTHGDKKTQAIVMSSK
jgi:hypothetical protein